MAGEHRLQLERYGGILNRRKWVLIIPIVFALLGAGLINVFTAPTYEATSTVRIDTRAIGIDGGSSATDRALHNYAFIVRSNPLLARAIENLGLDKTTEQLKRDVSARPIPESELLEIDASAGNGDEAAAIANQLAALLRDPQAVAEASPDVTSELQGQIDATRAQLEAEQEQLSALEAAGASGAQLATQQSVVEATSATYQSLLGQLQDERLQQARAVRSVAIIEPATPPDGPSSPRWGFNLAAGLLAGVVAGGALALALEYVDPAAARRSERRPATRLPVLASLPPLRWRYPPPPMPSDYRSLARKLDNVIREQECRSLLFVSTRPADSNTTVSAHAAVALAQSGLRVLLLDANLARPELHKMFGLSLTPGLYNFISSNGARPSGSVPEVAAEAIKPSSVRLLSVLTAGTKVNDPSELLSSPGMRALIGYLEAQYDVVLINGPAIIARAVDAVIVVVAGNQGDSPNVEHTLIELTSAGAETVGLVYSEAASNEIRRTV